MATNPIEYDELSPFEDPDLSEEERELGYRLSMLRDVTPSAEFRNQLRARLQMRMQDVQHVEYNNGHRPMSALRGLLPLHGMAVRFAALVVVILVMVTVLGTSYATAHSLPGQKLYFFKRSIEQVQVSLASPTRRSSLRLHLTERRLGELEHLVAHKADETQVIAAVEEYKKSVQETVDTVDPEHAQRAEHALDDQTSKITSLVEQVPLSAQHALVEVQESNKEAQEKARSRVPETRTALSGSSTMPSVAPTNTPEITQHTTVTLPLIISSVGEGAPTIQKEISAEPFRKVTATVMNEKLSPTLENYVATQEPNPTDVAAQATDGVVRKQSPTPRQSVTPAVELAGQTRTPSKTAKATTTSMVVQSATSDAMATRRPSPTSSATATRRPSPTSSATATRRPSPTSSATATRRPSPTNAPTNTPAPSQTPTSLKTPVLIGLPVTTTTVLLSTPVVVDMPTVSATPALTITPTLMATPALTNTSVISATPSIDTTVQPTTTDEPVISPTFVPTTGHMERTIEPTVSSMEPTREPTVSSMEPTREPTVSSMEPTREPTVSSMEPTHEPTAGGVELTPADTVPSTEPSGIPEATITPQLEFSPDMTDTPEITSTPGLVVTPEATDESDAHSSSEEDETPVLAITPEMTTTQEHVLDPELSEPQDMQGGTSGTIRGESDEQGVLTPMPTPTQTDSLDDAQTNGVSPETEQQDGRNMVSEGTTSVHSATDVITN